MLYTAEKKATVSVKVNGIAASCPSNKCHYEINNAIVPTVSAFTVTGNNVVITYSIPNNGYTFT